MRALRACAQGGARLQRGGGLLRPAVAALHLPPDHTTPRGPADWRSAHVGFARTALPWAAFPRGALDARHLSAAAAPPPAEEPSPSVQAQPVADAKDGSPASEQSPTQYVGPLAVTLRRVKLLSLGSLMVTTVGAPLLVFLSASEGVSEMAKISLSGTVVLFGLFTTGLLSYFASPYVLRLNLNGDDTATITTMDVLARPKTVTIRVDEMGEPRTLRPLATFQARGRIFFVDGNVADQALLHRMGLQKRDIEPGPPSGYDDSDEEDDETPAKKAK